MLKSPRYFATRRRKVCHGANSITCANTSLPACIESPPEIPKRIPKRTLPVQIVNTFTRHEIPCQPLTCEQALPRVSDATEEDLRSTKPQKAPCVQGGCR